MLNKLFISVVLASCQLISLAQQDRKPPRNFAGFSFALDCANLSVARGFEYERQFYAGRRFLAGVRGNYYQKYESGNFDFGINHYASGYKGNYNISIMQLWGTGYFFTSGKNNYSGFFISTALGLTRSVATRIDGNTVINPRYDNLLPGAEIGPGLQLPLSKKLVFRGSFTLSVSGSQKYPDSENHRFTLLCTKLSIGF